VINLDYDVDYELTRLISLFDSGHDPCDITLDKTSGASVMTFCDGISATLGWNCATINYYYYYYDNNGATNNHHAT